MCSEGGLCDEGESCGLGSVVDASAGGAEWWFGWKHPHDARARCMVPHCLDPMGNDERLRIRERGPRLRMGVWRRQHPSIACSRSQWHSHGVASSDRSGFDGHRSAARDVSDGAASANANGNPEVDLRVQAAGVVAMGVSSSAADPRARTDDG